MTGEPPTDRLAELRLHAEHAQRRLQLYRARAYGLKPVSEQRLRELERQATAAAERLKAAEDAQARGPA